MISLVTLFENKQNGKNTTLKKIEGTIQVFEKKISNEYTS